MDTEPNIETFAAISPLPYDFPRTEYVVQVDGAATIGKTLQAIQADGGSSLGYAHRGRFTSFTVRNGLKHATTKRVELAACGEHAGFYDGVVKACVVCDAAHLWPRFAA